MSTVIEIVAAGGFILLLGVGLWAIFGHDWSDNNRHG